LKDDLRTANPRNEWLYREVNDPIPLNKSVDSVNPLYYAVLDLFQRWSIGTRQLRSNAGTLERDKWVYCDVIHPLPKIRCFRQSAVLHPLLSRSNAGALERDKLYIILIKKNRLRL
jgi:hypothetical protein